MTKEMSMFTKQATSLLVKCNNSFKDFVSHILTIRQGQVTMRKLTDSKFNPMPKVDRSIMKSPRESQKGSNAEFMTYNLNYHSSAYMPKDST